MVLSKSVIRSAVAGMLAWLVYGIVEFFLAFVIPRFWTPELKFEQWQWPVLGTLFGAYVFAGLVAGGVACAFLARRVTARSETIASLTLAAAFLPTWFQHGRWQDRRRLHWSRRSH